jgi:DNA-directed RNA polymerase subunit M/transcription elongation factor TFIIS
MGMIERYPPGEAVVGNRALASFDGFRVHVGNAKRLGKAAGQGRKSDEARPNEMLRWTNANTSLPRIATACRTWGQRERKREMSKQAMRDETERLVKEALERKTITVKQGQTRIEAKCGKCGAPNRVWTDPGQIRVPYTCKECGERQKTL